jgi:regulatory factor X 4
MFDDYVLYLVESLHSQERANDFLKIVKGDEKEGRFTREPGITFIRYVNLE